MRELTLLETGYLAGLLLLSSVLPLLMGIFCPRDAATRKSAMKTVGIGQALAAFAVVVVLASAPFAPHAAAFGLASVVYCTLGFRRQFLKAGTP